MWDQMALWPAKGSCLTRVLCSSVTSPTICSRRWMPGSWRTSQHWWSCESPRAMLTPPTCGGLLRVDRWPPPVAIWSLCLIPSFFRDLSNNRISTLEEGTFTNLSNLTEM